MKLKKGIIMRVELIYKEVMLILLAKVVILGDTSVGKTSIKRKWMSEGFKKEYIPTLGASFSFKTIKRE